MDKLKELQDKKAALQVQAKALIAKDDATAEEIQAKQDEIKAVNAKISAQEQIIEDEKVQAAAKASAKKVVNDPLYADPANHSKDKWKGGIGEFLQAVSQASAPSARIDNRLILQNSASGTNENVGSEGGFLMDTDFITDLMSSMNAETQVANRIRKIPIGANTNKLNTVGIDENSRADGSRWGGVQAYWGAEAGTVAASKPKFRDFELKLEKLIGLCYATDELLQDSTALGNIIQQGFAEEMSFKVDDSIINGDGIGKPLGILNSKALITVPKETSQASGTIVAANINKMWIRLPARLKKNAVWYINQELDSQLTEMAFNAGTGGTIHPLAIEYLQKGTLKGAPVIPIEQAAGLGTAGDIILCDPTQYVGIDKSAPRADVSIHVRFLYDEQLFRFIYRFNGAPFRDKPITPYKGTTTLSPFVTLASR
ncbi:phage major capsid protein [Clostridium akagii]|uniref:phage major capsid protein n=1 Tax=Clostridium akagii TaxID=91623 RepID=UPI00047907FC|nr:phage major capsid protein [Clostridium akagii]